jgi:hypothetical protein
MHVRRLDIWLLVEPAHFVMGRRQLLGIRRRAQAELGDGLEAGPGRETTPAPSSAVG